jgi:tRNA(Ile)-lysidine synthase
MNISESNNIAQLDFEKLTFPLTLRKWQKGDKFKPLGMPTFKKLSDFFIDNKFSILQKKKQWLLCSADKIVWVVGCRIDNRFRVQPTTKKLYIAELLN